MSGCCMLKLLFLFEGCLCVMFNIKMRHSHKSCLVFFVGHRLFIRHSNDYNEILQCLSDGCLFIILVGGLMDFQHFMFNQRLVLSINTDWTRLV